MKRRLATIVAAMGLLVLAGLIIAAPGASARPANVSNAAPPVGSAVELKPAPMGAQTGYRNPLLPFIDFMLDDGSTEYQFGLNTGGHGLVLLALNRFTFNPGEYPMLLNQVSIMFPDPAHAHIDLTGRNVDLLVYRDTSGSGTPTNATKIYQATVQVQNLSPNFSTYPVSIPLQGPGDIYIGFSNTYDHGGQVTYSYPFGIDQSQSQRRGWIIGNYNGSDPDYNDIANNQLVSIIDDMGMSYIGNFLLRGRGEVGATPQPTATRTRTATPSPVVTRPPAYVLYDQYDHISPIYAANSQQYEPSMQPYTDYLADDFVVPAGQTWYLDEVDVAGRIDGGMGPVGSFNVTVYTSGGTVPGSPVFTATNVPYTLLTGGEYHIPLATPAMLDAGTYWLMVQGNLAYWTAGQFMWYNRALRSYNAAAWYNPGDGWGTTCTELWGTRWQCTGDASEPDQVYRLLGTSASPPTPGATYTPTATPTPGGVTSTPTRTGTPPAVTNTPTRTPTGLVLTNTPTTTGTAQVATITPTPAITNTPDPSTTPCTLSFTDVHPTDYFYQAVTYLSCHGAISGYTDGSFRPYNNTTRGQLSKIMVLSVGWPLNTTGGPHFTDVPTTNPFYAFIETAYNHGVISGYSDGTFRWGNNVTRGQLSKIVVTAMQWPLNTTGGPHFSDVPTTNPFYGFIETAYNRAIISGYSDSTFRPGNNATRGQIAKIVYGAITAP